MELTLHATVGPSAENMPEDVKLVRALLNVHRRQVGDPVLPVLAGTDPELIAAVARFQVAKGASIASGSIAPGSASWRGLLDSLRASRTVMAIVPPSRGQLTWDCEGQEGGPYHSRVLHVPSASSGLTLGRGYDLRDRRRAEVEQSLCRAGLGTELANLIASGVRLKGRAAERFIVDNDLLDFELTPGSQRRLFEAVYGVMARDVERICAKPDVILTYGSVDWPLLDGRIKAVLIDLRYRGDYTGASRRLIQGAVARNDLVGFTQILSTATHWTTVPPSRFERRKRFLA